MNYKLFSEAATFERNLNYGEKTFDQTTSVNYKKKTE